MKAMCGLRAAPRIPSTAVTGSGDASDDDNGDGGGLPPLLTQHVTIVVAAGDTSETAIHAVQGGCASFEFSVEDGGSGTGVGLTVWALRRSTGGARAGSSIEYSEVRWEGMRAPGVSASAGSDSDGENDATGAARYGGTGGTVRGHWNYPVAAAGGKQVVWLVLVWDNTDGASGGGWWSGSSDAKIKLGVQWFAEPLGHIGHSSLGGLGSPLTAAKMESQVQEDYRCTYNKAMLDASLQGGLITAEEHAKLLAADASASALNSEVHSWSSAPAGH